MFGADLCSGWLVSDISDEIWISIVTGAYGQQLLSDTTVGNNMK